MQTITEGSPPSYTSSIVELPLPENPPALGPISILQESHVAASEGSTPDTNTGIQEDDTQAAETHSTTAGSDEAASSPMNSREETDSVDPQEIYACKKAIFAHPMLPLLTLLLERCEQATQSSNCPEVESFDQDITNFVQQYEQDGKSLYSGDEIIDELMVKALQVLRIHLLEIEKVNELCRDFCTRYQARLKLTLQNEQLVHVNIDALDEPESPPPAPTNQQSLPTNQIINIQPQAPPPVLAQVGPNGNLVFQTDFGQPQAAGVAQACGLPLGQGQVVSGGTVYQMVQTPQGLVAQPIQIQQPLLPVNTSMPTLLQSATPVISQFGLSGSTDLQTNILNAGAAMFNCQPQVISYNPSSDDHDDEDGRRSKRRVLPKRATQIMKSWLFQHIAHPYPTEDEKRQIAAQTNLSLLQVNNWFINGRRRILQPMIDVTPTTDLSAAAKLKKNKNASSRSAKRFWPESLASMQQTVEQASVQTMPLNGPNNSSDDEERNDSLGEEEDDEEGRKGQVESAQDFIYSSQSNQSLPEGVKSSATESYRAVSMPNTIHNQSRQALHSTSVLQTVTHSIIDSRNIKLVDQ